jgi:hypothetical protein
VATPCSQWIARSPGWNGHRARPLSPIVRRHVRTWINHREDGGVSGFDISSLHSTMTVARVLRSVPGVSDVRRHWFAEVPLTFTYQGVHCSAFEMFGDNSRITIGADTPVNLDWEPVRTAFERSWGGWIVATCITGVVAYVAWTKLA